MTLPLRLRKVSDGLANPLNTGLLVVYPLTGARKDPSPVGTQVADTNLMECSHLRLHLHPFFLLVF